MEDKNKKIDAFLESDENSKEKEILKTKTELVEVDNKQYITNDGRNLLKD